MKTTVKLSQLRDIAFAPRGQQSIIEPLYIQKPDRGGSNIAYRIASLRGTAARLLGEGSAFAAKRDALMDEYFDKGEGEQLTPKDGPAGIVAYENALKPYWDIIEEIDVELFPLEQIEAAGYLLSGAEQDALMGLLVQPETTPEAAT